MWPVMTILTPLNHKTDKYTCIWIALAHKIMCSSNQKYKIAYYTVSGTVKQ